MAFCDLVRKKVILLLFFDQTETVKVFFYFKNYYVFTVRSIPGFTSQHCLMGLQCSDSLAVGARIARRREEALYLPHRRET